MVDEWVSLAEAARIVGRDRVATYHRFMASDLPKRMLGHSYMVTVREIESLWAGARKSPKKLAVPA
jgi:hypothetical protein